MAVTPLSAEETYKLSVIRQVIKKELKPGVAAKLLRISPRQVRRLRKAVREEGDSAVIHKLKGKLSNHHIAVAVKEKTLRIIQETYGDFKPGFAAEKLEEQHQLHITSQTIRVWMIEQGLWKPRKQKQGIYRSWRPRKEYFGELLQFDGSYHYWFENRYCDSYGNAIEICLLAAIDDATGKITKASFARNEGLHAVFTFWQEYVKEVGKPMNIYLDKFVTYKINHKAAVDNKELMTQFERAMQQLGIRLITAHSAEAKGRVERLFQTLQDRLVKDMRLANVCTPEQGNIFLKKVYLQKFNNRFSVIPAKNGNAHRPLQKSEKANLHHVFSVHDTRRVNLDFTIQFKNNWYQLTEIQPTTVRPLMIVLIETWLDGSVHIILKNHELTYMLLPEKPKKQRIKQPVILTTHTLNYIPPPSHPWRRYKK